MDDKIFPISEIDNRPTYDRLIEFCLIFLIIFTPLSYGSVQPWSIAVFEITAALMALIWFLKMLKNRTFEFTRHPLTLFIFLFIAYICFQLLACRLQLVVGSLYKHATKTELLKIVSYALIFSVTLNTIKTRRQINRILSAIITVGFVLSVFFLMRYFGAKAPRGIINPDHFSGYLGMIIPLALGLLFIPSLSTKRFLLFFTVITMGTALFFTMSRGGMFSFIAALLFMVGLVLTRKSIKKKGWILSVVLIFIIVTIAWLGATPVVEKILSIKVEVTSLYFGGRFPIWQGTINIIKNNLLFGTGLGTFNYIFPKYQLVQNITKHYSYAHSDFLELLSEAGVVGFSIFLLGLIVFAVYAFARFRKRHNPWVIGMSIGIFGSLASIFVHSFADFNLRIPANAVLLAIILPLFIIVLNYRGDNIPASTTIRYLLPAIRYTRYPLYALTSVLVVAFAILCVKPAIADYYAKHSTITDLKRAIALNPMNADYHYKLGKLYTEPSAISHQLSAYKKAVELNPINSKYHQSLGWTYGNIGRSEEAIQEFEKAINSEPNNPYRHRAYAVWLFHHPTEENIVKGVAKYRKTIELEPKLGEEAFNRYYKLTGDYSLLEKIIPHTADGYLLLAGYLNENGLIKKSIQLKKQAVSMLTIGLESASLKEKVQIHMRLAGVYRSLGESDKATNEYQKAIKINSENFWAYYWTGVIYKKQGNYEMAIKILKKASAIDPQNSWSYFELARIYEKKENISQAKAMWQTILNLKTPSPDAKRIAKRELKKY